MQIDQSDVRQKTTTLNAILVKIARNCSRLFELFSALVMANFRSVQLFFVCTRFWNDDLLRSFGGKF